MNNKYSTFGMRGWRGGWPDESGFYVVKAFKRHEHFTMDSDGELVDLEGDDGWKIDSVNSIIIKSYFYFPELKFDNVPENFLVAEWLDETPVIRLYDEETSDEFWQEWDVDKPFYSFNRDVLLKLLNSCTKEQATLNEEKRRLEQIKYEREQYEQHKKTYPDDVLKAPPQDNTEF